jgi:hypothetical protein
MRYLFLDADCCRQVGNAQYAIYLRQRGRAIDHWQAGRPLEANAASREAGMAHSRAWSWWGASLVGGTGRYYYYTRWGR